MAASVASTSVVYVVISCSLGLFPCGEDHDPFSCGWYMDTYTSYLPTAFIVTR